MCVALQSLDKDMRRDYDTAQEIAPVLVDQESRIQDFVKRENGDIHKAAVRLAKYWKVRKSCFGERWLLPLHQTSSGALNRDDIQFLRSGFFVTLPIAQDKAVVLYDESKLDRPPGISILRCTFYYAVANAAQMHDITFMHVVTGNKRPPLVLDPSRWNIILSALPMKVSKIVVVQAPIEEKKEIIDFMAFQLQRSTAYKSRMTPDTVAAHSVLATRQSLWQNYGIPMHCLPHCLGGTFGPDNFQEWIRVRLSRENAMAAAPLQCYRSSSVAQVNNTTSIVVRGSLCRAVNEQVQRLGLDEQDAARQKSAMYSRRSYQKQKLTILTLQNQCRTLSEANGELRQEHLVLTQALQEALWCIATLYPLLTEGGGNCRPSQQQLQQPAPVPPTSVMETITSGNTNTVWNSHSYMSGLPPQPPPPPPPPYKRQRRLSDPSSDNWW